MTPNMSTKPKTGGGWGVTAKGLAVLATPHVTSHCRGGQTANFHYVITQKGRDYLKALKEKEVKA